MADQNPKPAPKAPSDPQQAAAKNPETINETINVEVGVDLERVIFAILIAGSRAALGLNASADSVVNQGYQLLQAMKKAEANPPVVPKL